MGDIADEAMPPAEYAAQSDALLEALLDALDAPELEDAVSGDFDAALSQGVLTLKLGEHGTWVINKQAPNQQVWWSSPVSGPKRFQLDRARGVWVSTRDGQALTALLREELLGLTRVDLEGLAGDK